MNAINNVVIKNTDKETGRKIIEYFKSLGIDTGDFKATDIDNGDPFIYYGVIGGFFDFYSFEYIEENGAKIITLPDDFKIPALPVEVDMRVLLEKYIKYKKCLSGDSINNDDRKYMKGLIVFSKEEWKILKKISKSKYANDRNI